MTENRLRTSAEGAEGSQVQGRELLFSHPWRVTYRYRGLGGHGGRKSITVRAKSAAKAMERVNREGHGIRTAESAERV